MLHANAEVVKKRIFKTFNRDDFQKYLSRVPFHAAYVFDDMDDVYWCWETLYNPVQCDLFAKLINNNGKKADLPEDADKDLKDLLAKAECLVHYTYESSNQQLMLLDIQGSGYCLYNPEIATNDIMDASSLEYYFCCGNYSSMGITCFLNEHECNAYCKMMDLSQ